MTASFTKGPAYGTPFGLKEYLRSTKNLQFESYTVARTTVPTVTLSDGTVTKVLHPGVAMAKITSGGDSGKVGPVQSAATDGRQTAANFVGINDTFLPTQLQYHDCNIAVLRHGTCVQAWCQELNSGGTAFITLTNTTRDALRGTVSLDLNFV